MRSRRYDIIEHRRGVWRVVDTRTGEFVATTFSFVDAAESAQDLERNARQRGPCGPSLRDSRR